MTAAGFRSVLVTGAAGYVGRMLLGRLVGPGGLQRVVGLDVREVPPAERVPGVLYVAEDVRSPRLAELLREHAVDVVAHLAFVVTPGPESSRETEYAIDVLGTRNVLDACQAARVRQLVVTSSGAAYGYHADNPVPLREDAPLRGNEAFAYAHHKRLVEEMLARHRAEHPELAQLVLRVCTVLGERTANQITRLFEGRFVLGVAGAMAPWSFVHDEDLVECLVRGIQEGWSGVYNVAGDGALSMREIARRLGKPYLPLPEPLLRGALAVLHPLGVLPWGPEQTMFLRHRPVLSNEKLKHERGFTPRRSGEEAFALWMRARGAGRGASFAGRAVLVTGAASGIGRALAGHFASDGARLALLDRDASGLEAVAASLRADGAEVLAAACDVADAEACQRAVAAAEARFGGLDVLACVAGISQRSPVAETDLAVLRRVMDVNFFGAVHCTRAALSALARSRGRIVVISSVAGFAPLLGRAGYCASKHALHGFFDTLRGEVASRGMSVTLVCPGFTATRIEENALGGSGAPAAHPQSRVGRVASPEEVAEAVHRATLRRRRLVVLGGVGHLTRLLVRVWPGLYDRLMRRALRVEVERAAAALSPAAPRRG
jgi:UDP-glucose 4-epimerase